MARVRDILFRFRPAGARVPAAEAGVPVDRAADLAAELEPLFAQLADAEAECAAFVERAQTTAAGRRERDAQAADSIVADADMSTKNAQRRQRLHNSSTSQRSPRSWPLPKPKPRSRFACGRPNVAPSKSPGWSGLCVRSAAEPRLWTGRRCRMSAGWVG